MKRNSLVGLLIAALTLGVGLSSSPASAAVQQCGQPPLNDPKGDPVIPKLTTRDAESRLKVALGKDVDSFLFLFTVEGCALTSADGIKAEVRASKSVKKALGEPTISAKETLLIIEVPADSALMPAGESNASVTISGDAVPESYITVTASKKAGADKLVPVVLIALLIGWGGALLARYGKLKNDDKEIETRPFFVITALIAAAAATYPPLKTGYFTPEVWAGTLEEQLTLGVALATAAGGAAVAAQALRAFREKTT